MPFNPLFIEIYTKSIRRRSNLGLSILFSSSYGDSQWKDIYKCCFQSSFHREIGIRILFQRSLETFNPLFIELYWEHEGKKGEVSNFQSSFHRDELYHVFGLHPIRSFNPLFIEFSERFGATPMIAVTFNPLFIEWNYENVLHVRTAHSLSILFSSSSIVGEVARR